MPDLSQIILPNNDVYTFKDAEAREEITAITNAQIDALFDGYDLDIGNAEGESF